jgi:hypothetical protein
MAAPPLPRRVNRVWARAGSAGCAAALLAGLVSGCSFHHNKADGKMKSAFDLEPGNCVAAPTDVTSEISKLRVVPCTTPHTQEVYAIDKYDEQGSERGAQYPGESKLDTFAKGVCGQHYESYVGVAYQDSSLFFTYLMPSARSWQDGDDRNVICFVTTTGNKLTSSVKGSKR